MLCNVVEACGAIAIAIDNSNSPTPGSLDSGSGSPLPANLTRAQIHTTVRAIDLQLPCRAVAQSFPFYPQARCRAFGSISHRGALLTYAPLPYDRPIEA